MRRATRAACAGRSMRTAMSASLRSRSSDWFDSDSSMTMPGCCRRNAASIGGNTSAPTTSLQVIRTTPRIS